MSAWRIEKIHVHEVAHGENQPEKMQQVDVHSAFLSNLSAATIKQLPLMIQHVGDAIDVLLEKRQMTVHAPRINAATLQKSFDNLALHTPPIHAIRQPGYGASRQAGISTDFSQ